MKKTKHIVGCVEIGSIAEELGIEKGDELLKINDTEIEDIENNRKNYQTSVYYLDIINHLERMGDYIINISQDLHSAFANKK